MYYLVRRTDGRKVLSVHFDILTQDAHDIPNVMQHIYVSLSARASQALQFSYASDRSSRAQDSFCAASCSRICLLQL
jgi:hypothetical protein